MGLSLDQEVIAAIGCFSENPVPESAFADCPMGLVKLYHRGLAEPVQNGVYLNELGQIKARAAGLYKS